MFQLLSYSFHFPSTIALTIVLPDIYIQWFREHSTANTSPELPFLHVFDEPLVEGFPLIVLLVVSCHLMFVLVQLLALLL